MLFRPSALIDFADPRDPSVRLRRAFGHPVEILRADTLSQVRPVLAAVERHARAGRWCVGGLKYEAAAAFDPALDTQAGQAPLAWFAVHQTAHAWPDEPHPAAAHAPMTWSESLDGPGFRDRIDRIHEAIRAGEVYQINLTAPVSSPFAGDALSLFHALHRAQPQGYAALIDMGEEQVLSVSPELFFDWRDGRLLGRPMKGTAARGATPQDDAHQAEQLRSTEKERAENLMIVDLIRNDLSRVAELHSVRVPRLFHLEALPTVWQMTSDVEARTRAGVGLADVFAALFPCGSVTGAPKVQAMRLIRALEDAPRGFYCGAVGVVQPGGAATFNVPIRTVTLRGARATCGIGSGITLDATAPGEWGEWRSKRAFLERVREPFELLETLKLSEGVCLEAQDHLARMARAAAHFGFAWHDGRVREALDDVARDHPRGPWRVRLLAAADGAVRAQAFALEPSPAQVEVALAPGPMDSLHAEFIRFKTTRRGHYDAFAPAWPGLYDTLLWNERGEVTEFTRGNVAVRLDGRWVTPPLACGLLGGIGRACALREGRVSEQVVRVEDLARAEALAFVNALRGWIEARLVPM